MLNLNRIKTTFLALAIVAAAPFLAACGGKPPARQVQRKVTQAAVAYEDSVQDASAVKPLADLVGKGEADHVGGYDAGNAGKAMDLGKSGLKKLFGKSHHQITIGEIMDAQDSGKLHAAGRYQIIGSTMKIAVRDAGLSRDDKFNRENQDKLFLSLLRKKRPSIWSYLTGRGSIRSAIQELAQEWASVPTEAGKTYYGGGGDRAHVTVQETKQALTKTKARVRHSK